MWSCQDRLQLIDLTEEGIGAIVEHGHLLEIGNCVACADAGVPAIKNIIADDLEQARRHGHDQKILQFKTGSETLH